MKKRLCRRLTALLLFCLLAAQLTLPAQAVWTTVLRPTDIATDELFRAAARGLGDGIYDTEPISFADYYALLGGLISRLCPGEPQKLDAWNAKYPAARDSAAPVERINAMYLLYAAAHDILGGEYALCHDRLPGGRAWGAMHSRMGNGVWDEIWLPGGGCVLREAWFPDNNDNPGDWAGANSRTAAAYFFSFAQTSRSGSPLFDYDAATNSMRVGEPLTVREALLSVLRLSEVPAAFVTPAAFVAVESGAARQYRADIITPELLARAQYLPTPTADALPYYTGVQHDWISEGSELTEAAFRLYAELGMNYVRVTLSCRNFFGIGGGVDSADDVSAYVAADGNTYTALPEADTAITKVDLACLTRLDEVVRWGLQYGLHICVQFTDYPGHIQFTFADGSSTADTDFFINGTKQAQTAALWEMIAARYRGIPSSVLSFATNHEPDNNTRATDALAPVATEAQIKTACERTANAVKAVDPDRFQFYQSRYDLCLDPFMAGTGLAQASFYAAQEFVYWNLITDANLASGYYPEWPFYCLPRVLCRGAGEGITDHTDLTIDGFLPVGTRFDLSFGTVGANTQLAVTGAVNGAVKTETVGAALSFTLAQTETALTIRVVGNGYAELTRFLITLPGTYAKPHWYTDGGTAGGTNHVLYNDAKLEVKLAKNTDNAFNDPGGEKQIRYERAWLLDAEAAHADLTITGPDADNACSYTSKYGYDRTTLARMAELYAQQRTQLGVQGMNFELAALPHMTEDAVCAYLDDLLSVFQTRQTGWALFFYQALFYQYYAVPGGENNTCGDETELVNGVRLDTRLAETLQKYMAPRPTLYTEVPALSAAASAAPGGYAVTATVRNPDAVERTCRVLAAAYDGAGRLTALDLEPVTLAAGEAKALTLALAPPGDVARLKVFCLLDSLSPLAAQELELPA